MGLRQNFINLAKSTASLLETLRPLGQLIGMIIGLFAALATIIVKVVDGIGVFARAIFKGGGTFEVFAEILKGNITTFEEFAKAARGGADDVSEIDKAIADSSSNLVVLLPPGTSPNKSSRESLKKMALINQLSWGWFKLNNKNKVLNKKIYSKIPVFLIHGKKDDVVPLKPVSYTHLRAHETKAKLV